MKAKKKKNESEGEFRETELSLFTAGSSGVWTSWGEPLANFREAVNEVFLMAGAMQMYSCVHT